MFQRMLNAGNTLMAIVIHDDGHSAHIDDKHKA